MDNTYVMMGVLWYSVFVFSTVCHEFAHAWSACRFGDPTPAEFRTLNPAPHVRRSIFGMVILPLVFFVATKGRWMFGYASVPVNPHWVLANPRRNGLVALAGPLANFALAFGGLVILALLVHFGGQERAELLNGSTDSPQQTAVLLLDILITLNLGLGVFNLLPLPPLDGSNIAGMVLPRSHLRPYFELIWNPYMGLTGLMVAYYLFGYVSAVVAGPILRLAERIIF